MKIQTTCGHGEARVKVNFVSVADERTVVVKVSGLRATSSASSAP